MTFAAPQERQLFEVMKDRRRESQAAIVAYVDLTGLHPNDFAKRIGYAPNTVKEFLASKNPNVSRRDWNIIEVAQKYMAAHPIAAPAKHGNELFETANVRLIRETFNKLLLRPRAFMIYAPPGSQKTFVVQHEVYALNARELANGEGSARAYLVRARERIAPTDMMRRIASACGSRTSGTIDRIIANLRHDFQNRQAVLVIDEAQLLSISCFEVIRELLDTNVFSLLIMGSHDLFLKFQRASATLEQWNSRIAQKVRLPGVTQEEALAIVDREVGHILGANAKRGKTPQELAQKLIDKATVVDVYVPVAAGQPKATYINIRTLTNALDDLQMQYAAAQKESAA